MEKLFGLEMSTIAGVLSAILILVIVSLAILAWRQPVFFKLGLRPIPRRRAQSALIILGLMLATLIITAAFVTGDTLSYTIRLEAIKSMGEMDEAVRVGGGNETYGGGSTVSSYFKMSRYETLLEQLAGYPLVDHVLPAISESVPVVNITRRRSLRSVDVMGLRPEDIQVLSKEEISDASGQPLALEALGEYELYLNASAAEDLGAAPGDVLDLYSGSRPKQYTVRLIAAQGENPRILMNLDQAQALFNQRSKINYIIISNQGDALGGAAHSQAVTAYLRGLLSDSKVAAQLFAFLRRDPAVSQAIRTAAEKEKGNTKADLLALAGGLEAGTLTPAVRSLLADEGLAGKVETILADASWGSESVRDRLGEIVWRSVRAGRRRLEARHVGYGGAGRQRIHHHLHRIRPVRHHRRAGADLPDFRHAGCGAQA